MKNVDDTFTFLKEYIKPIKSYELISIEEALNRVLSEDILARKNLPSFDNTALDGYAFAYKDKDKPLSIKGSILAGDTKAYAIGENECFSIMTGAKIPKGADTIMRIEDECIENEKLIIKDCPPRQNAIRFKAEELKEGQLLFKKGEKITAAKIALLASQGIYKIAVVRKIRIAIFSTGDELKEPWQSCSEDMIYNANALGLKAVLKDASVSYLGIIKDDLQACMRALDLYDYDILITSGAASVGVADYLKEALVRLDYKSVFDGVKMKPGGKPTKLFQKGEKLALVLPGNPHSAYLSALIFARKLIALLSACIEEEEAIKVPIKGDDYKIMQGRDNIILGNLVDGYFIPHKPNYGMAFLLPLVQSPYYALLSEKASFAVVRKLC